MMSNRIVTRDSRWRVRTMYDRKSPAGTPPIVEVLSYVGDTRMPSSITVRGKVQLDRQPDGTYISLGSQGMTTATDLSLNQRTGRLDWWDSQHGFTEADIWHGRPASEEGVRAFLIFALIFIPPAWPLMLYYLFGLLVDTIHERLHKRVDAVLDFVTGAYRV